MKKYLHSVSSLGGNLASSASGVLLAGVSILDDLMKSHGFAYSETSVGRGSGGEFAAGEFRRGDRRLELHFRYSLGLVKYHAASVALPHEEFMLSVLGKRNASHYPEFSSDPLDGFRHLLMDLQQYGADFLAGSDAAFAKLAERARALEAATPRLP